ncbi:alpha/beta fold hydrolase [Variovorax sp. J22R24]|nr:alpha/beta fold hydrolase [Variovorax sp. J22R24]MDM0108845.1 alpha/beta fold hydrolase [Variovorax sp. J22R24]
MQVRIPVDGTEAVQGTIVAAPTSLPGVLIVHGWDSDQAHYQIRAEDLAALGCVCMTFDLRGHGRRGDLKATVSRADNLRDVLAAFDLLAGQASVDPAAMALIGTSYGGYLAAIASAEREVRWLALRVPAPYPDDGWNVPKQQLDRAAIRAYREKVQPPESDRALAACLAFRGDVLVVGSDCDRLVPREGIASYVRAFQAARSITHRMIAGADHGLSDERSQRTYDALLSGWLTEMILGARTPDTHERPAAAPAR